MSEPAGSSTAATRSPDFAIRRLGETRALQHRVDLHVGQFLARPPWQLCKVTWHCLHRHLRRPPALWLAPGQLCCRRATMRWTRADFDQKRSQRRPCRYGFSQFASDFGRFAGLVRQRTILASPHDPVRLRALDERGFGEAFVNVTFAVREANDFRLGGFHRNRTRLPVTLQPPVTFFFFDRLVTPRSACGNPPGCVPR